MVCGMIRALCLLIPLTSALVLESSTWGPSDSVHALDGVIKAVNSIVANPHLSPTQLVAAKKLAEDVKQDVEAVEAGNMTKQQTKEKVGAAIKELTSFASQGSSNKQDKINMLMKQLDEKKKALAKVESMMKLLKLKKALAEKKLTLEKLIMKKSEGKAQNDKEMTDTSAAVSKMLMMAKNVSNFGAITATLQEREKVVSASLARIVDEQAKGDAKIDAVLKAEMGQAGKSDFDVKKQKMFKHLKTEENRKFAKARALRQNELNELKDAEQTSAAQDATGLTKVLSKMQREERQLEAKSGNFLH